MKKFLKCVFTFLTAFALVIAVLPFSNSFFASALSVGEEIYVNTHNDAINSATNAVYHSSVHSVRFLKTRETEKICYCIEPGSQFTRTRYKVMKPKSDPYFVAFGAAKQEKVSLAAMFGFPAKTAKELGASTDNDAYAATQAVIWESMTGDTNYRNGIIGTPAETPYNNIISAISSYQSDSRYVQNAADNTMLFTLETATTSEEQALICFEGKAPQYPVLSEGSIEIYKKNEFSQPLAGASFTATNTSDNSKVYLIGPTNSNGYAKTEKIPFGTYKVVETVFPTGYMRGAVSEWTVTLNKNTPDTKITINAVNEQIPGSCKIVKTSEDGEVDGISFRITGNGVDKTITTQNGGQIQIDNLKPAVYTVSEITADKYEPQEVHSVTVVSGEVSTVTFNNVLKRGDLSVTKTSEDGLIEGVKFHLYGTSLSGLIVDEYAVTNADGIAIFKDVLISNHEAYTIEEVDTAERYIVPASQQTAITWNTVTKKNFYNKIKRGNVTVKKTSDEGNPIKGAVFGLFGNNETEFTESNAIMLATSGEDGIVTFEKVAFGTWLIKEIKTATDQYVPNDTVYKAEISEDGAVIEYEIENRLIRGSVTVIKIDAENPEKKLAGAVFEIYLDVDGDKKYTAEIDTLVGEMSEGELGVYRMDGLKYGGYFLYEKSAPKDYVRLKDYFFFEIKTDGEVVNIENLKDVGFANNHIVGSLKIVKTSSDNNIEGFSFRVKGENGYDMIFTTDKSGEICIKNLKSGKYTVSEIADDVSAGYILAEDKTVVVEADTEVTAEMHNEKKPIPEQPTSPKTGDNSQIGLYFLLVIASFLDLILLSFILKRYQKK